MKAYTSCVVFTYSQVYLYFRKLGGGDFQRQATIEGDKSLKVAVKIKRTFKSQRLF